MQSAAIQLSQEYKKNSSNNRLQRQLAGDVDRDYLSEALFRRDAKAEPTWKYSRRVSDR